MVSTEQLAKCALSGDGLKLRGLTQDWLRENTSVTDCEAPSTDDPIVLAIAAGLVEMFAIRRTQNPPPWSASIGGVGTPLYLVRSALTMRNLRRLCEAESPLPLQRRNLFAPPTFLE